MDNEMNQSEASAAQTADIEASWVNVRVYTESYMDGDYHELVVSRGGTVLDEYNLALDGDVETRTDIHRLKSVKGTKMSADELQSKYGAPKNHQYNPITREIR